MLVKAVQKTTRQTPRKLALVANTVRGESLADAVKQLAVMQRRASLVLLKVMRQAIANAMHNHQARFEDLELKEIIINEGPRYKRWRAVSRGRAHGIVKRTSHVTVVLKIKESAGESKETGESKKTQVKKAQSKKSQPKKPKTQSTQTAAKTKTKVKAKPKTETKKLKKTSKKTTKKAK